MKNVKTGFYPGSFDPFTVGHLHVIKTSAKIFDRVIIGIGKNNGKGYGRRYDEEVMKGLIKKVLKREGLSNVFVTCYEGLTVNKAKSYDSIILIRGLRRNGTDYEKEENDAEINDEILGMDTMYLRAGKLSNISSTTVMELFRFGIDISTYVPNEIRDFMIKNK